MILFDYEKMWLLSGGKSFLIVRYFKYLYMNKYGYRDLKGANFILNPEIIIRNTYRLSNRQLAEYIGLCSLRNLANYRTTGTVDLELEYFPAWIPRQVVDDNPLIAINNTKIIFLKEKQV